VQPALQALDAYLEHAEPYSDVHVFLFQHGTNSPRIARPAEFAEVINRHGARAHFDGLDPRRFPHDIGTLGRYGRVFDQLPRGQATMDSYAGRGWATQARRFRACP
jgi:hypothetical protein